MTASTYKQSTSARVDRMTDARLVARLSSDRLLVAVDGCLAVMRPDSGCLTLISDWQTADGKVVYFNRLVAAIDVNTRELKVMDESRHTITKPVLKYAVEGTVRLMFETGGDLVMLTNQKVFKWDMENAFRTDSLLPYASSSAPSSISNSILAYLLANEVMAIDRVTGDVVIYQIEQQSAELNIRLASTIEGIAEWLKTKTISKINCLQSIGIDRFTLLVHHDDKISILIIDLTNSSFEVRYLPTMTSLTDILDNKLTLNQSVRDIDDEGKCHRLTTIMKFDIESMALEKIADIDDCLYAVSNKDKSICAIYSDSISILKSDSDADVVMRALSNPGVDMSHLDTQVIIQVMSDNIDTLINNPQVSAILQQIADRPDITDHAMAIDSLAIKYARRSLVRSESDKSLASMLLISSDPRFEPFKQSWPQFKSIADQSESEIDPKAVLLCDIGYLMTYAKTVKSPDCFELIFTHTMNEANCFELMTMFCRYFSEELVNREFFIYWLQYLIDEGNLTSEQIVDRLLFTVKSVQMTFDIDQWAWLLYFDEFWQAFDGIDTKAAYKSYISLRFKYFMFDRYCHTDWICESSSPEEWLVSNICVAISGTEAASRLLGEVDAEVDFMFDSQDSATPVFAGRFAEDRIANCGDAVLKRLMEMDAFDFIAKLDIDTLADIDLEKCLLSGITTENSDSIKEICDRDSKLKVVKTLSDIFGVFGTFKVEMNYQIMNSMKRLESAFRLLFDRLSSAERRAVIYNAKKYDIDRRSLSSMSKLLNKLALDSIATRLDLKQKVDTMKDVDIDDDLDVVSIMVEHLMADDRLDMVPSVLVDSSRFSYERVERLIFTESLKSMVEGDKSALKLSTINWPSARLEGLRCLSKLIAMLADRNMTVTKDDIYGKRLSFTSQVLAKVWQSKNGDDDDLRLIEVFKMAYGFESMYLEADKMDGVERGLKTLEEGNKKFTDTNKQKIEASRSIDAFKNAIFVKFMRDVVMPELFEKSKLTDLMALIEKFDASNRKDLAAIYLSQLVSSSMAEELFLNFDKSTFTKRLRKLDKQQKPRDLVDAYVISNAKGELAFAAMANANLDMTAMLQLEYPTLNFVTVVDTKYLQKSVNLNKAAVLISDMMIKAKLTPVAQSVLRYAFIDSTRAISTVKAMAPTHKSEISQILTAIQTASCIDKAKLSSDIMTASGMINEGQSISDRVMQMPDVEWHTSTADNDAILATLMSRSDDEGQAAVLVENKKTLFMADAVDFIHSMTEMLQNTENALKDRIILKVINDIYQSLANHQEILAYRYQLAKTQVSRQSLMAMSDMSTNSRVYKAIVSYHDTNSLLKYFCLLPDSLVKVSACIEYPIEENDVIDRILAAIDIDRLTFSTARLLIMPLTALRHHAIEIDTVRRLSAKVRQLVA